MATLKTNYKDDVLNIAVNTNRRFNLVDGNGNVIQSNVSLVEVTDYDTVGDNFGSRDINETNNEVNQINLRLTASNETAGIENVPFNFVINDDGEYGYLKKVNGADTFSPFKNPQGTINITSNGEVDVEDYKKAQVSVPLDFTIQFTLSSSTSQGSSNSGTVTIYCRNGVLSGGYGSVGSGVNIYSYSISSTATASNPRFV